MTFSNKVVSSKTNEEVFEEAFTHLANEPVFSALKKYDPETFGEMKASAHEQFKKGASQIEVVGAMGDILNKASTKFLPKASNKTLIKFARLDIDLLQKLEDKEPILCLK